MSDIFTAVTGAAAPILLPNIDTDTIAPGQRKSQAGKARELSKTGTDGDMDNLFGNWRYDEKDNEVPDFILNQDPFRKARIILAGENFGCGSSRESACWLLAGNNINCVIAPSFGEIFYNNCFKNGILPIVMSETEIAALADEAAPGAPDAEFTVDLDRNSITTPTGKVIDFAIPAFRREGLLTGADEIALTVQRADEIADYHAAAIEAHGWRFSGRA